MAQWPASLDDGPEVSTLYISEQSFQNRIAEHCFAGQAWQFAGRWSTYQPNRKRTYKNLKRLSPRNVEDFREIMSEAYAAGLNPPTSFADFFRALYRTPRFAVSPMSIVQGFGFGGWQTAPFRGHYPGHVWHYDLNRAYRWAACQGLPDPKTAYYPKKFLENEWAVYRAELRYGSRPYAMGAGIHLVTAEEIEFFKIRPVKILNAIAFKKSIDLSGIFDDIDAKFPGCSARISRAFWGSWNGDVGVQVLTWKSGAHHRIMGNPWYNPVWSAYVTSRVKLRMARHIDSALHIYVDSIHSTEELPTHETEVGAFKLMGEYPGGVNIRSAGVWGSGTHLIKHSGLPHKDGPYPIDRSQN